MFFIPTERFSDFNSMIERYEQEMRKLFAEKQKETGFSEKAKESFAPIEIIPEKDENEKALPPEDKTVPEGIGNIIVEVTTGRGAVPLSGVDVVIDRLDIDDPRGRKELVAVKTTDQSGRTKPVPVKTVSRELSLEPGSSEPFSTFYVTAFEKDFEPVKNRPVDVFANEVSILKIDLVPKPEKLYGGGANG
ncbi:MAG: hypothetical protein IJA05_03855 [Oscillospiraceae bacterium]|nr:hypothetical protein [Oscillospiraceae bacterium]